EEAWGASLPTGEGLGLRQTFDAARQGTVKAMLLIGDSVALHSGELGDVTEALESLELLVVQDLFLSPLAQRAQVVLPQVSYAEQAGTYTNLERRVQRLRAAVSVKKSEARTAWWALCQLAQQMGAAGFDYQGSADILEEIASLVPLYGGITRPRLRAEARPTPRPDPSNPLPTQVLYSDRIEEGLLWPCPDTAHPGTPILYAEGFPGGMARLLPVQPAPTAPSQDGEWPLLFLPGRVLLQPEREMEVVRASGSLKRIQRDEWVELHPEDAAALGIAEGAAVVVTTTPGQRISGVARLNPALPRGSVAVTLLFGQLALELEASEDPDPMSKVPGLVIAPAQVTRV
ncbi:MAG: molybdopterin oxidoreductase family protein, partial [Dehalococcoidia bacterium]